MSRIFPVLFGLGLLVRLNWLLLRLVQYVILSPHQFSWAKGGLMRHRFIASAGVHCLAVFGVLCLGGSVQPVAAQDSALKWQFNEYRDTETRRMTANLTYGIPETDAVKVQGVCEARSGTAARTSSVVFSTDVGALQSGANAELLFSGGGFSRTVSGTVEGVGNTEERIAGVRIDVPHDDALWRALMEKRGLDYFIPGYRANTLDLKGAKRPIQRFIDTCRGYAEALLPDTDDGIGSGSGGITEKEAFSIAKELGTLDAWQAFLDNFSSGFRADLARAYVKRLSGQTGGTNNGDNPTNTGNDDVRDVERLPIRPKVISVGRWPEGITYDGRSLWVAESGRRSIAEVNPRPGQRRRLRRMNVGRLPVDIAATSSGNVFVLNNTDNRVWRRRNGSGRARSFARVPRCANNMAADARNLWIISDANCQSPTYLYRVRQAGGSAKRVVRLARQATDIATAHGRVYVAHRNVAANGAVMSIYSPRTGDLRETNPSGSDMGALATNSRAVFLGGGNIPNQTGLVRRMRVGQSSFGAERRLPRLIIAMAASEDYVVAIDRDGTVWVLDSETLDVRREITSGGAAIRPRDALIIGNSLYVTSSEGSEKDRNAAVLVLDGWQPNTVPGDVSGWGNVKPIKPRTPVKVKTPKPRACSGGRYYSRSRKACRCPSKRPVWNGVSCERKQLSCAKNYKLVNGKCVVRQNCGRNAYRNVEGDCFCKTGFVLRNGKCRRVRKNVKCTAGRVYSQTRNRCVCPSSARHWYGGRCRPVPDCPGDSDLINGICQKVNEPAPRPKKKKPVTINELKNNCSVLNAACKLGARAMCRKFQRQCQ